MQQEWDIDLAEESEQKPLARARWGRLLGAEAAAAIQPGGLGEQPLQVTPEQTLGTTPLLPGTGPLASVRLLRDTTPLNAVSL